MFAVENIVASKLYEPASNNRIFHISPHIGMCIAGLLADAKHLVDKAKEECAYYRQSTGEPIPLSNLAQRLSEYIHVYTLYSAVRPFGVSVMLCSMDKNGPNLYMIEPSGLYYVGFLMTLAEPLTIPTSLTRDAPSARQNKTRKLKSRRWTWRKCPARIW